LNSEAMLKIGIKYCGGCNPYYNRVALVGRIKSRLQGKVEFVSPDKDSVDLVLAVEGCKTACADLSSFDGKELRAITQSEDADEFIREILG
jgi:hypothetical protein